MVLIAASHVICLACSSARPRSDFCSSGSWAARRRQSASAVADVGSKTNAAPPEVAKPLYDRFCALCRGRGVDVQEGVFRATMQVRIVNEGPVTLLLDSRKVF